MVEVSEEPEKKMKIKVKVQDHEGHEIEYEVKRSVTFARILEVYCKNRNKDAKQLRLSHRGKPVSPSDSLDAIGLEDGDILEVMAPQVGGSLC
jgi:uncharacterized ubiquitin-like protein YukD